MATIKRKDIKEIPLRGNMPKCDACGTANGCYDMPSNAAGGSWMNLCARCLGPYTSPDAWHMGTKKVRQS
jgi:hypothetical protein